MLEKFLKTRQKFSQPVEEWKRSGSKKIVVEFQDAFIGSNLRESACTKPSEFGQQSNFKGNGSNNTGLHGTCSDSASESNVEDLRIDFNNEDNKMEQSAKEQIKDQNKNKLEEEQQVNSPVEGDGKIHDHTINWNTTSIIRGRNVNRKILSAQESDKLSFKKSKEVAILRKELCKVIEESNLVFGSFVNSSGNAMTQMSVMFMPPIARNYPS